MQQHMCCVICEAIVRKPITRKILPDHAISQCPDCGFQCTEHTARCMIAHIRLDDRLAVLRAEDRFRTWKSLDDQRLCIICIRKFSGRQVEIRCMSAGRYELRCPTDHCNSRPHLWIYPKTPLVSHVIRSDRSRAVGRKQRYSAVAFALRPQGKHV